jgi:hypothetical protein
VGGRAVVEREAVDGAVADRVVLVAAVRGARAAVERAGVAALAAAFGFVALAAGFAFGALAAGFAFGALAVGFALAALAVGFPGVTAARSFSSSLNRLLLVFCASRRRPFSVLPKSL